MFGFIRETEEAALKAGFNKEFNICRTSITEYLKVIFPNNKNWIHDKQYGYDKNGKYRRYRPDYLNKDLMIVIEIDGLPHYQNPDIILSDIEKTHFYESEGYKVIRIPYFIQLTNKAVKTLFNVDTLCPLFPENIPSMSVKDRCSPAYMCIMGIDRMNEDFIRFPDQKELNKNYLKNFKFELSRYDLIK